MTGETAITYIHSMQWNRRATGYEHAKALLEKMGNPEKKLKYIHIGGTNGKGSTAAMLAKILEKAGYKTGLFTSPYIYRFHERIQINGRQIGDEDLGTITEYVKSFVDTMEDCPSEFALISCIAFEYFAREHCDIVVLEVGMGGEKDSTNVIDCPEVAIMTNIGLDHTEYLGETLEEIATTKAGILKEDGTAVFYPSTESVNQILKEICNKRKVQATFVNFQDLVLEQYSMDGQAFCYGQHKNLFIPLLGGHQLKNAAVAISAVDALNKKGWDIEEENLKEGLKTVTWPGRFEIIHKKPLFIIDGGHNPQCIDALAENIKTYFGDKKVIAITGVLEDKDYNEMYGPIFPYIEKFFCITPPSPRKLEAIKLASYLRQAGAKAEACDTIHEAIKNALIEVGEDDVILCFGSLYSVGELRDTFNMMQKNLL